MIGSLGERWRDKTRVAVTLGENGVISPPLRHVEAALRRHVRARGGGWQPLWDLGLQIRFNNGRAKNAGPA
jgi:hypothetical protein